MARLFGRKDVVEALVKPEVVKEEIKNEEPLQDQPVGSIREVEINLSLLNEKLNVIINLLVKQDQLLSKALEVEDGVK